MSKGINPNIRLKAKSLKPLEYYIKGIREGDRFVLSEALTLIESNNRTHRQLGEEILGGIDLSQKDTLRIGITGSPGVGKSTFIESLGRHFITKGKKVSVLAVDPSSTKSQGSILGDKTRMPLLSTDENAFVRPTASANRLGGVAQATKESIALCEAAGYDIVLIESVGVGQSETELADLVDIYLLLLLPGGGDGVQGIKRGIVELADVMVVNKYDGDYKSLAERSRKDFAMANTLFHHDLDGWRVPVLLCSSLKDQGFDAILEKINTFESQSKKEGFFSSKREKQDREWLSAQIKEVLIHKANQLFDVDRHLQKSTPSQSVFNLLKQISNQLESDFQYFMKTKQKD